MEQLQLYQGRYLMISVGIDVSKGSSSVCMNKDGRVMQQFLIEHTQMNMKSFINLLLSFDEQPKVILEATGIYHLPLVQSLSLAGIFVSIMNPLVLNKYAALSLRKGKTDKLDAVKIADYGLANWHKLIRYSPSDTTYNELKDLGRNYAFYVNLKVTQKQHLILLLDKAMPGITALVRTAGNDNLTKNKLLDFVEHYQHYDRITVKSERQFVLDYSRWAKKKGYRPDESKACSIYALAKASIPTSSSKSTPSTALLLEAVQVLRQLCETLQSILSQMKQLAKDLPEYKVVCAMQGVGNILAVRLIAEIGDVQRFHSGKSLVAFAGLDSPPYQSGNFVGTKRSISKRGSPLLRKTGFEVMKALIIHKPQQDNAVYLFMVKKASEGKAKKVAMIAGLNKFFRIYYARVKEVYDAA
jgi:transposase